jgi:hypothetical protein
MNSIIVGFSRPQAWFEPFSWLIRLVTGSQFSHAYIRFYDQEYDRWVIYQASGLKVNFIGQAMFDNAEFIYQEFNVPVSDATKKIAIQGAIDKCGSPYGVGQIIGYGAVLFMRIFSKKIKNPLYSGSSYVCSELVADILMEIDAQDASNIDPSTMTPKDVYDFMIAKGFKPTGG